MSTLIALWVAVSSVATDPAGSDQNPLVLASDPSFVEFDFNPIPRQGKWELVVKVSTEKVVHEYKVNATNGDDPESLADSFVLGLRRKGFKAEVIDKVKVRVYGGTHDGKYYPSTQGTVTSPDLKADELPKVKNPEKKG